MNSPAEEVFSIPRPLVIGHRGCAAVAPENTIPSFQLALDTGVDLVELDYHHSQDGVPMVIHDPFLDRTTNARKRWRKRRAKVASRSAAELQSLDAGRWKKVPETKIPRLTEALELICGSGKVALIERKSGDAATLVRLLRDGNWINKVIVMAFDWRFLKELHDLEPRQVLGVLGPPGRLSNGRRPTHLRRGLGARLKHLAKTGARLVVWNRWLSKRAIRLAQKHGLPVWVYTVNNPKLAQKLVRMGVRGVITDNPGRVRPALTKS